METYFGASSHILEYIYIYVYIYIYIYIGIRANMQIQFMAFSIYLFIRAPLKCSSELYIGGSGLVRAMREQERMASRGKYMHDLRDPFVRALRGHRR
jgi:hypothetical protein